MNEDPILLDFLLSGSTRIVYLRSQMVGETPLFDSSSEWQMFTVSAIFSWLEENRIPVDNHRGYNYWLGKLSVKFWDKEYVYSVLCEFAIWWETTRTNRNIINKNNK